MYKVLLVDDEVMIREAIAEKIDWENLGFELVGLCENGKEAIEFIKRNPPELILTDICMPYVDGLELAEYVYENYDQTKVVIISGYDNFEYAKGAIKYRVMEYILKPVTAIELSETLKKVKERLDGERLETQQMDRIKEAYHKSMPLLKERFLNQLIHGKERCDNIEDTLAGYDLVIRGAQYAVVQMESASSFGYARIKDDAVDELAAFAVFNVLEEMCKEEEDCVVFQDGVNTATMIIGGDSEYTLEKRIAYLCGNVQEFFKQQIHIHTMVVAGICVDQLDRLHHSYESLVSAREYKFLFENDSILYGREFVNRREKSGVEIERWAEKINVSMKQNKEELIGNDVTELFRTLKESFLTKEKTVACIQGIILKIVEDVEEEKVLEKEQSLYEELKENSKIEEMETEVKRFCMETADILAENRESIGQIQAANAVDYIEKNYQDAKISLNSVCKYLAMSTSYFSLVFKNYTGDTFIEALTKKRMEKAKELLETTDLRTYQIAEQVGYSDPHYFGSTFKKYVGETPKEYAKKRK